MHQGKALCLWLGIGVFLPLLSALPSHAADKWVEVRSPHFVVATDAGEKRGREVAQRFEQMRAIFGQLMLKDKVKARFQLQLHKFIWQPDTKGV